VAVSPSARVSRQSPNPGVAVQPETTVEAWFEVPSPPLVTVPSIIGDSREQAAQAIAGARLTLRQATTVSAVDARVSRQCPTPGGQVQTATVVEAWFEAPSAPLVTVPSIIGDTLAQAGQAITGAHLALNQATPVASATARVSQQDPPAGTQVKAETVVKALFEAPSADLVTVPSIIGDTPAQAGRVIAGAHLALKQATEVSPATARVSRQFPFAGAQVKAGTSVEAGWRSQCHRSSASAQRGQGNSLSARA
jgi:beta-lactam-binding protein with PASTA domain